MDTDTIETIPTHLLAEHLGYCATHEEAEQFRSLAIARGFALFGTRDFPSKAWFALADQVLFGKTK